MMTCCSRCPSVRRGQRSGRLPTPPRSASPGLTSPAAVTVTAPSAPTPPAGAGVTISIVTTQKYLGTLDEADDTAIDALRRVRNRGKRPGSPGRGRSA
jgi:hypothetical protein